MRRGTCAWSRRLPISGLACTPAPKPWISGNARKSSDSWRTRSSWVATRSPFAIRSQCPTPIRSRPAAHDHCRTRRGRNLASVIFCVQGVSSPLLANLFLHYAFDFWMQRHFPGLRFERYADDAIVHCRTEHEARVVLEAIRGRFAQCRLELHPVETRIVYCKRAGRPGDYANVTFDFPGSTFQPRLATNRRQECFVGFLPAISAKAAAAIRTTIRQWRLASTRNNQRLEDLAQLVNPVIRGWASYYGRFYRSKCLRVLRHLNVALAAWVRWKYKRFR